MKIFYFITIFIFTFITNVIKCYAQEDLMKSLQSQVTEPREKVIATFKGDKIINMESNETVRKMNLDVRISHLFGNVGAESGGGIHNLYGLDQSADIRIALHVGLTDKLMIGVSRAKRYENLEGLIKYRLLEQTSDNHIPLAITLFGNMTYSVMDQSHYEENIHRLTYNAEAIFARKFSKRFSLAFSAGLLHRNFVEPDDENNTYHMAAGFRYKFTRSSSIIADFTHTLGRDNLILVHYDVIGAGFEIETGGHVFSIMFSNASGILENDFLVNTEDSWGKGGFKLSFIISRMFPLRKEHAAK